jgi:outer membrane protein
MRKLSLWLVLCSALGGAVPVAARAESIADAWRMARETDASLAAVQSESSAAGAAESAAARQRWPVVRLTGSYSKLDQSPALDVSTPAGELHSPRIWRNDAVRLASAELTMPLWTAGRIAGAIRSASDEARAAAAQARRAGADLELGVVEAYLGVLRARSALTVAESNARSLEAHAGAVRVMYEKEAVPQSDLLAARVALANANQQRLRAANVVRLATAAYNRRVGQPLDRVPDLDEPADSDPSGAAVGARDVAALASSALQRRAELEVLAAASTSLEHAAEATGAERWPQLQLRAGFDHFDNQILDRQNVAMVGIGFEWRLFDGGATSARVAALRHRARAAARQLEDTRTLIALEVESAVLNLDEARARVAVTAEAVAQAEENLRIARELYGSGLATNTQVLDAESLRVGALTNRDNARYDLQFAHYQLRHATGGR